MNNNSVGFGALEYSLAVYIANRPQLDDYPSMTHLKPMVAGEVSYIASQTSNHWRKVFNVCAKFIVLLKTASLILKENDESNVEITWQQYRDLTLFQQHSNEALLFSAPDFRRNVIHIVAGKQHAETLGVLGGVQWLDNYFAVNTAQRLIVCPYPDYRQLSNVRIERLVTLVQGLRRQRC